MTFPADKMIMRRRIRIKAIRTIACRQTFDLPQLREQRQISVNCPQADIRVFLPSVRLDHIGSGMVLPLHQLILDGFPLSAVFEIRHRSVPLSLLIIVMITIFIS